LGEGVLCVFGRIVSGVRVLADGGDDDFFGVDDDTNDVPSVRPNDFVGSLKRRKSKKVCPAKTQPSAVRPRRGSALLHRSERDDEFITPDNPAGWTPVIQRQSWDSDPTADEVFARLTHRTPSPRRAKRTTLEDVAQFMRDGQWDGIYSRMTSGHPELYEYPQGSEGWYIDAQGYVRIWERLDARSRRDHLRVSMSAANLVIVDQVWVMVEKGLAKIPAPANPGQRRAMENVYALLGRELVESISRADRQARLEAVVRENPDVSLRELARQEGTSKSTIHRLRKRLDEGVPL
jgi:hypothetical protein